MTALTSLNCPLELGNQLNFTAILREQCEEILPAGMDVAEISTSEVVYDMNSGFCKSKYNRGCPTWWNEGGGLP